MRRRHPSCPSTLHRPAFPRHARVDVKGHSLSLQREEGGYAARNLQLKKQQHGEETAATFTLRGEKGGDSLLAFLENISFLNPLSPFGLTNAVFMSSFLSCPLPNPLPSPSSTSVCQDKCCPPTRMWLAGRGFQRSRRDCRNASMTKFPHLHPKSSSIFRASRSWFAATTTATTSGVLCLLDASLESSRLLEFLVPCFAESCDAATSAFQRPVPPLNCDSSTGTHGYVRPRRLSLL